MFRNYLKIAWRSLKNNKFFSFINIFGLAVGLTCCMLISIYLYHEFTYDHQHSKADRIFLVGTIFSGGEKEDVAPNTPSPLAPALQQEFPEIQSFARTLNLFVDDKTLLQYTDQSNQVRSFYETRGYMADSSIFKLFDYEFKEGNAQLSLNDPNSIVISDEVASKIFGDEPALNKVLHINSNTNGAGDYKITGVFRQPSRPSHMNARFFMSLSSGDFGDFVRRTTNFSYNNMFYTYVLLKPGTREEDLEKKLPQFVEKYMAADMKVAGFSKKQFLVPLKDIHLRSGFGNRFITSTVGSYGNLSYLYILALIAIFILIIACINFMNLATARSAKRAAEVGIRKVLGAEKNGLIRQFLGESMMLALISFAIAIVLVVLLLPLFGEISGAPLRFDMASQYCLWIGFAVLTIIAGLLAGSYPAFYLSAFKPIKVLKGKFSNSLAAVNMRKALVVFQFIISAGLIICAMGVGKQMKHMTSTDMGFKTEQRIIIPLRSSNAKNIYTSFRNELSQNKQVLSVGASQYYPGILNPRDQNFYTAGKSNNEAINLKINSVDPHFLNTLDIQPVAGRIFSEQFPADTNYRMVLNETAIRDMGFKNAESAIGQPLFFDWEDSSYRFTIIGVVRDFNFESLQKPITPFAFQLNNDNFYNYIIAQAGSGNMRDIIASLESAWKKLNPTEPFEYSFLDQDFQKNYEGENRLAALIQYFMIIAIIICCLGLFGLAAFSAEQRTKEIGIRKVLGSSIPGIMSLLSKDFVKLVLIGNIVAIPIAWYLMNEWLKGFAYRTSLEWWLFAIALCISVFIALFTVSFQAIRAALANPVKSLRSE